ncbi:MAG: alpha/beta fold hydrolase [Acidimicrobiales bacterium]
MADPEHLYCHEVGQGERLVLVHGFTQTGRSFDPLISRWQDRFRLAIVDAPGHGRSGPIRASVPEGAELVGLAGGPACYLGYSMGGRLCLQLALDRPHVVNRLVLVGATAGIEDPTERKARRRLDEERARLIVDVGVEAFLVDWLAGPLFASLSPRAGNMASRLDNTAEGLASSLRLAGTGTQESLWHRLAELAMPVLIVVGANDPKFDALGQRMVGAIGANSTLVRVPEAGHAAHLENPEHFASMVEHFLKP